MAGQMFVDIDDKVRNSNYIYRYGDRKASFERKMRLKEMFEVVKSFAQIQTISEKIDWLECFKFALEQYGIENSNKFFKAKRKRDGGGKIPVVTTPKELRR